MKKVIRVSDPDWQDTPLKGLTTQEEVDRLLPGTLVVVEEDSIFDLRLIMKYQHKFDRFQKESCLRELGINIIDPEWVFSVEMETPDGWKGEGIVGYDVLEHKDSVTGHTYTAQSSGCEFNWATNPDNKATIKFNCMCPYDHEFNREHARWGTRGKSGEEQLKILKVKEISNNHLKNIITHLAATTERFAFIIKAELEYREAKGIFVEDYYG